MNNNLESTLDVHGFLSFLLNQQIKKKKKKRSVLLCLLWIIMETKT